MRRRGPLLMEHRVTACQQQHQQPPGSRAFHVALCIARYSPYEISQRVEAGRRQSDHVIVILKPTF